jgi:hypothetical protein
MQQKEAALGGYDVGGCNILPGIITDEGININCDGLSIL